MDQHPVVSTEKRSLWLRVLYMLLMTLAYQVSGAILFLLAVTQFIFSLFAGQPNQHLTSFARSLGLYFQHIVNFLTFVTEEIPFPFSDWPS